MDLFRLAQAQASLSNEVHDLVGLSWVDIYQINLLTDTDNAAFKCEDRCEVWGGRRGWRSNTFYSLFEGVR